MKPTDTAGGQDRPQFGVVIWAKLAPQLERAAYAFNDGGRAHSGTNAWKPVAKLIAADKAADHNFGYSVSVAGDLALVGAPYASSGGVINTGAAYVFESSLYGPPAITNVFRTANACSLCFDCQPAWHYDVQCSTNLLDDEWRPVPGLTNLDGHVSGSLTVEHTNGSPSIFYRLLRHEP